MPRSEFHSGLFFTILSIIALFLWSIRSQLAEMTAGPSAEPVPVPTDVEESLGVASGPLYRVVRVADGDSVEVVDDAGKMIEVRLAAIDAPEYSQPYGRDAATYLRRLCDGQDVHLHVIDTDRYGRSVAWMFHRGANVNLEMVRAGMAWQYKKHNQSAAIARLQAQATADARGLWSEETRLAPWVWRERQR